MMIGYVENPKQFTEKTPRTNKGAQQVQKLYYQHTKGKYIFIY